MKYLEKLQNPIISKLNQALAQSRLNSLGLSYIPHSDASINPDAIEVILCDIIINKRKKIVEFGTGISTIYIAKLLGKDTENKARFISFEHDKDWIHIINNILKQEKISHCVDIIHTPLNQFHKYYSKSKRNFYDWQLIQQHLSGTTDIDCVIVDGPPANMIGGGVDKVTCPTNLKRLFVR